MEILAANAKSICVTPNQYTFKSKSILQLLAPSANLGISSIYQPRAILSTICVNVENRQNLQIYGKCVDG